MPQHPILYIYRRMAFVYPSFLWALLTLLIPVLIHLFNFRRYKKVYFTNVKFLKEIQLESKSRSRLREILILASRVLALACLVLAFCQPLLPSGTTHTPPGAQAVSIYIDNSFSMQNVNAQGPLLEVAKSRAKELVQAFGSTDRFQVLTNDFEGRHQRLTTRDNALTLIDEIKASPTSRLLSDVIARQREFLKNCAQPGKRLFVFSDAQRSTFDVEHLSSDTLIRATLIPLKANKINNVYVDTCWFETPLQQKGFIQRLHAVVVNNGDARLESGSARLFLNSQQKAIASFSLDAQEKSEVVFTFECREEGLNYGSVRIEDYPITFDDELFFSFNSKINLRVTLINGQDQQENNPLTALFRGDSLFSFTAYPAQSIDYNVFKSSNVIVLNQLHELSSGLLAELVKFTAQDGALVIIPPLQADLPSYTAGLAALQLPALEALDSSAVKMERIDMDRGFYQGVFEKTNERMNVPLVNKHYALKKGGRSLFSALLTLQNGDVWLGVNKLNNSAVYLFTSPLSENATNFYRHALFVPTFYQVAFGSVKPGALFYNSGEQVTIQLKNTFSAADQPPHIRKLDASVDVIPEVRVINNSLLLYTRGQVTAPGFYLLERGTDTLMPLAFNFPRRESDLKVYEAPELEAAIAALGLRGFDLFSDTGQEMSAGLLAGVEGKKLWKLFIIFTLLFFSVEVLLLRVFK